MGGQKEAGCGRRTKSHGGGRIRDWGGKWRSAWDEEQRQRQEQCMQVAQGSGSLVGCAKVQQKRCARGAGG